MYSKSAIIIGAGIGGLALSVRLQKMGYKVTVLEAQSNVGGKLNQYSWQDYRFDTGPSLFTLPDELIQLFKLCGQEHTAWIDFTKLDLVTRYFFSPEKILDTSTEPEEFAFHAEKGLGVKAEKVRNFLQKQKATYETLAPVFLDNPIHKPLSLFKPQYLKALFRVMDPVLMLPLHHVNQFFFKNKDIVKLFDRYGTYNGSNPYIMPSLFNIISHLEHNVGAFFPKGGMYSVASALEALALQIGVEIKTNHAVSQIVHKHNRVEGVTVQGELLKADIIVSNVDTAWTYQALQMPQHKIPKSVTLPKSTSALIFHWAMQGTFDALDVHNILFASDYKAEFCSLFKTKKWYHDPTIYIYISKKLCASDAPDHAENWFVMINMPSGIALSNKDTGQIRDIIEKKIKRFTRIDPLPHRVHEHIITPADLEKNTGAQGGALYGPASNSIFSAFLRHPNFSNQFKNLYFVGGTVHPGGGIPLCLKSASITASLIQINHA